MFRGAKVGDKVWRPKDGPDGEWGKIARIDHGSAYPIRAFDDDYTIDGKLYIPDPWPSIFWGPVQLPPLPTRPKRKVKKVVERWVNVYRSGYEADWTSEDGARRNADESSKHVATVHLTGEYEVEE